MQIETERLLLREYVPQDWEVVHRYHADPTFARSYEEQEWSEQAARDFVGRFIEWQAERPRRRFQLACVLKGDGSLIGNAGLRVRRLVDFGDPDATFEADVG